MLGRFSRILIPCLMCGIASSCVQGGNAKVTADLESASSSGPTSSGTSSTSSISGVDTSTAAVGDTASESAGGSTEGACTDIVGEECKVWLQNCPVNEKCVQYAECGADLWTKEMCVPVMENPAGPGEECFVVGNPVGGLDNCEKGAVCWAVDETNTGYCVSICEGTPDNSLCADPETRCVVDSGASTVGWCLEKCDPIAVDCSRSDELCIFKETAQDFVCMPLWPNVGGKVQLHEACGHAEECAQGLLCLGKVAAVECDQSAEKFGCCEPFCNLQEPNQCPGAGQQCIPFHEGEPPLGQEHVGICSAF